MDRTVRFYKIDQMLNDCKIVPRAHFLLKLTVSPTTFNPDLEYLRVRLNARTGSLPSPRPNQLILLIILLSGPIIY